MVTPSCAVLTTLMVFTPTLSKTSELAKPLGTDFPFTEIVAVASAVLDVNFNALTAKATVEV